MIAETTTGCLLSASATGEKGVLPEDLGGTVSRALCEEVLAGGCYDSPSQVGVRVCVCARQRGMMNGALHFLLRSRSRGDDSNHMRFLTLLRRAFACCRGTHAPVFDVKLSCMCVCSRSC